MTYLPYGQQPSAWYPTSYVNSATARMVQQPQYYFPQVTSQQLYPQTQFRGFY